MRAFLLHYYSFNVADYILSTAHLSAMEDIAYRRLIDLYYSTEKPIPLETESVARRIRLETNVVNSVLNEFFTVEDDGFHNKRCDDEIAEYLKMKDRNKKNGKAGGRKPKTKSKPTGNRLETESQANQELVTSNQEPIEKKESPNGDSQPAADHCPHGEILDLFAKTLPQLTQPLRSRWPSSAGANNLRVRWREDKRHQTIEFWAWFFGIVASSPFHLGQNDRNWKADLPWLLERRNFDKMLERGVSNGH